MKLNIKSLLIIAMLFISMNKSYAQEDFEDDTEDIPAAPINDYVLPMLLIGVICGFQLLKRKPAIARR